MTSPIRKAIRALLPRPLRAAIGGAVRTATRWPPVGQVDFGDLRRRSPISTNWGFDRGEPIDRVYIESFLNDHRSWIRGRVLEVKDRHYTEQFGSDVAESDVLDPDPGNPEATVIADLSAAPHVPDGTYDCIILTQTLQLIFDIQAALRTASRILKPDGTLLITVPGLSPMGMEEMAEFGVYWHLTSMSVERLLAREFHDVDVRAFGNVFSATCFLYGLAASDVTEDELLHHDPDFEVIIAARATRPRVRGTP
jgi:SAM-dependent methyltransferase